MSAPREPAIDNEVLDHIVAGLRLRRIELGNATDRIWMEEERYDLLDSLCAIAASHLTIAREAAFLRDRKVLDDHLRHGVGAVKLAIKTFNLLPTADASDGEAKAGDPATPQKGRRSGNGP